MTDARQELLTDDEQAAVRLSADLANALGRIIQDGPNRNADLIELIAPLHVIQRAILANAAARAYPDQYRLLGSRVGAR